MTTKPSSTDLDKELKIWVLCGQNQEHYWPLHPNLQRLWDWLHHWLPLHPWVFRHHCLRRRHHSSLRWPVSTLEALYTPQHVVDFLALLRLLTLAKQYLICSIDQSIQQLQHEIDGLRDKQRWGNKEVVDKIAVLRAEIAYSQTIQADSLSKVIATPGNWNLWQRRGNQQRRHGGGGILNTITNTPHTRGHIISEGPVHRQNQDFKDDQPQVNRHQVHHQQMEGNLPPYDLSPHIKGRAE